MNEITYTYQIVNVDEAARCMEVVYSSEGRPTIHVGTRLPYADEPLLDVVQMYAPVPYWRDQEKAVAVPQVGLSGVVQVAPTQTNLQPQA